VTHLLSEDRLSAVIESSPVAIMEVDLETRVIGWNRAAERIFGWTREELLGRPGIPMVPPAKHDEHEELVARVRAGESYSGHETVRQRKDGTLIEVTMAAAPVQDETGRVVSHVVVYDDISARRRQEKRLAALIDSSPVALVEFDEDTRIRLWNPAAERIFGWTREEMSGRGGVPMAPESKQAESQELAARVRAGEWLSDYQTVRQRKDGTPVDVSISAAPVRDASGRVFGNMVAYTDITERKAQEERLHAVIDASPIAIVEFDLDGHVRLWNPAAERIFGWSRAEILGQRLPMVPESKLDESDDLRARVHAGETYTDYETVRVRKDGTLVDVSIAAAPVRDGYGRAVSNIAVYADITERKAQQAELHRLVDDLAASRARIVAAGDVERKRLERNLHDGAQQRLVTLALSLRLALGKVDSDPAAVREALVGAGEELSLALDELRELARGLHPAVLSDHGLRAGVESLAARSPVPVKIEEVPDERLPERVEAAAYYLVAEALTNMAKYAQASEVRVALGATDAKLVVDVTDDGVGGADAAAGSGLRGLADRVEALGGSLEVVSPSGSGTSLRAEIPIH
jgi:PAS domain S-box-containing protein